MNVKTATWTICTALLICALPLFAQSAAPQHASPVMFDLCANRVGLPPALRAHFCPAIPVGAETKLASKSLLLHDYGGALQTPKVAVGTSAQTGRSATAASGAVGSYVIPPSAPGTYITFDVPGAVNGTSPSNLNNNGAITGSYDDGLGTHGFVRNPDGSFVTFDVPGAVNGTFPSSINNAGASSGFYSDNAGSGFHGFVRSNNGSFTTFDVSDTDYVCCSTVINASGAVAGSYFDVDFVQHSFLRQPNGALTTFDPPGTVYGSSPTMITPDGLILGTYYDADFNGVGFLRDSTGGFMNVTGPDGLIGQSDGYISFGTPLSVTPGGEIAGTYFQPIIGNPFGGDYRVFLMTRNGEYTTFDAADYPPCCIFSSPSGINPAGAVTGSLNDGHDLYRGFLRTADGTLTLLDVPGAGTGNFQGTVTIGITPAGVVAGSYVGPHDGNFFGNHHGHGFLFMPQ